MLSLLLLLLLLLLLVVALNSVGSEARWTRAGDNGAPSARLSPPKHCRLGATKSACARYIVLLIARWRGLWFTHGRGCGPPP